MISTQWSQAAQLYDGIWCTVLQRGELSLHPSYIHVPDLFPKQLIESLELPQGQIVTLIRGTAAGSEFDRQSVEAIKEATTRTRMFENIQQLGGWPTFLTMMLIKWAKREVICRLFVSGPNDHTFDEHVDLEDTFIVQLRGTKHWYLRPYQDDKTTLVATDPGSFIFMPATVNHRVETPELDTFGERNLSVHIQFAVLP